MILPPVFGESDTTVFPTVFANNPVGNPVD